MQPQNRFSQCLLEQKNEESRQARRRRCRSILIAILIQVIVLALLMLRPLFGAPVVLLAVERYVPLPPWKGSPGTHEPPRTLPAHVHPHIYDVRTVPFTFHPPDRPAQHFDADSAPDIGSTGEDSPGSGFGDPNGLLDSLGLPGIGSPPPAPPVPPREPPPPLKKPRLVPSEIQQAMLISRVEPAYPELARQIRLEGTVVIRAVIGRDGRVESAEVVSGHQLFVRAALDAILQWRYRPTLLNGQPVEVETLITVIFRLR